jgi:hypothetical protein
MIPEGEPGCKICEKSIYRIFVEHIQQHLDEATPEFKEFKDKRPLNAFILSSRPSPLAIHAVGE